MRATVAPVLEIAPAFGAFLGSPMLRGKVSLSLLAATIAYFVCAYAKADSITVRASNGLTDKLAVALFPYAKTTTTVVPANVEPAVIFRDFCGGSVTDTYLDLVNWGNPAIPSPLAKAPTDRTYDLPACPQLKRTNATTSVQPGETLGTLIRRTMGAGPSDVIQDCTPTRCYATTPRASIARRNGGTLSDLDHLTPSRIIQLPYIAYWTTVPLKPDASAAKVVAIVDRPCLPSVAGALQPPSAGTPLNRTSATVCPPTTGPILPAVARVSPPEAAPSTKVTLIYPLRATTLWSRRAPALRMQLPRVTSGRSTETTWHGRSNALETKRSLTACCSLT